MVINIDELDKEMVIWRYTDLYVFENMIKTSTLFFAETSLFDDNFEGSMPRINYLKEKEREEEFSVLDLKKVKCASCWHQNKYESEAMWKIFSDSKNGIAIKAKLKNVIDSIKGDKKIYVGKIKYIDYENDSIDFKSYNDLYYYKRKIFSSEKEIRFLTSKKDEKRGLFIDVDFKKMIDTIYVVNPETKSKIKEILKKYNYDIEIKDSCLCKTPLF